MLLDWRRGERRGERRGDWSPGGGGGRPPPPGCELSSPRPWGATRPRWPWRSPGGRGGRSRLLPPPGPLGPSDWSCTSGRSPAWAPGGEVWTRSAGGRGWQSGGRSRAGSLGSAGAVEAGRGCRWWTRRGEGRGGRCPRCSSAGVSPPVCTAGSPASVQRCGARHWAGPPPPASCSGTPCWRGEPRPTPRTGSGPWWRGWRPGGQLGGSQTEISPPPGRPGWTSWSAALGRPGCNGRTRGRSCTTWHCTAPPPPCRTGSAGWPSPPVSPAPAPPSPSSAHWSSGLDTNEHHTGNYTLYCDILHRKGSYICNFLVLWYFYLSLIYFTFL